jgi:hypothetical protein
MERFQTKMEEKKEMTELTWDTAKMKLKEMTWNPCMLREIFSEGLLFRDKR